MDYIELNIPITDAEMSEILVAELADLPFESFESEGSKLLKAYIPHNKLVDCKGEVDDVLARYNVVGARYISIETQNWNAEWESNFERVEVGDRLLIRAPFHDADARFESEVVIMPKMSFGTGHHATTYLMSQKISTLNLQGKRGLDMGSGTGVLSIVAVKYGAASVDAIDIDEWADENCRENIVVNGVERQVTPMLGDASLLKGRSYDFILANINRNILLADMARYVETLSAGGELLLSGFFVEDIPMLREAAERLSMQFLSHSEREGWALMHLIKG